MIQIELYGMPDDRYLSMRRRLLELLQDAGEEFHFEEHTSLEHILQRNLRKLPCLMVNNEIADLGSLRQKIRTVVTPEVCLARPS